MMVATKRMALLCALILVCSAALGQVVVREIPCPSTTATGLCWDGEALWVSDYTNRIWKLDPVNGTVLDSITGPVNGSRGLAFENGYVWTASRVESNRNVFRLDTATGAVNRQVPAATRSAGGLVWDGSALWISVYFPTERLIRFDPLTGDTLSILVAPGQEAQGLAWDDSALWNSSVDSTSDRIYRINPADGSVRWWFDLPAHVPNTGRRPRGLAYDGECLWVLANEINGTNMRIFRYDVSNATNPDIELPVPSHDFSGHVVGFPVTWETKVRNIGNLPLVLDSVAFAVGDGYELLSPATFPVTVMPRDSEAFVFRFNPPVPGVFDDTLWIHSNDPNEDPTYFSLHGVGWPDEGNIELDPVSVLFGSVRVGGGGVLLSTSRYVTISNTGYGVLRVTSFELDGDSVFFWDGVSFPLDIDSSASHEFRVWFNPTHVRAYSATLLIHSDDPDNPITELSLSGDGNNEQVEESDVFWYWEASGSSYDNSINSVGWLSDVNGDGFADAVAAAGNYLVYCINGNSDGLADTLWTFSSRTHPDTSGYVFYERGMCTSRDLTGDGIDEVIIGTTGISRSVFAINGADGTALWRFDTHIFGEGGGWVYEVAPTADLNGDQVSDVLGAAGGDGSGGGASRVWALSGANGQLIWDAPPVSTFYTVRAIRDVNGDNVPDVVGGATDGGVHAYSGATGAPIWSAEVGDGSPVFAFLPMGNANPAQTATEDVAIASAYEGIYCLDGGNGAEIWTYPTAGTFVYEIAVGSDITGDAVNEVLFGTTGGLVVCLDGSSGSTIWSNNADPFASANVLCMTSIPDVTGDGVRDLACGTLGDHIVLLDGWDGARVWYTEGIGPSSAIDAISVLPDIDGTGTWEVLAGSREGIVQAISTGGEVSAANPRRQVAVGFALSPAFPNPFNVSTVIPYSLGRDGRVTLTVFDVLGRQIATLVDAPQVAGTHSVTWNGRNAGSGVYFVRMKAGDFGDARKIVLIK